jgi:hypothetical protein
MYDTYKIADAALTDGRSGRPFECRVPADEQREMPAMERILNGAVEPSGHFLAAMNVGQLVAAATAAELIGEDPGQTVTMPVLTHAIPTVDGQPVYTDRVEVGSDDWRVPIHVATNNPRGFLDAMAYVMGRPRSL